MKKTQKQKGGKAQGAAAKNQKGIQAKSSKGGTVAKNPNAEVQNPGKKKSKGRGSLATKITNAQWQEKRDRKDRNTSDPEWNRKKNPPAMTA